MNETLFYRCEKCGNIVASVNSGGGELTCCGQAMTKLQANSTDAAKEKHVPVLTNEGGKIKISVGAVAHPMTAEHYIQWIALVAGNKLEIVHLKPGMDPEVKFIFYAGDDEAVLAGENDEIVPNCEGSICNFVYKDYSVKATVYAYCNLHGLWKADL